MKYAFYPGDKQECAGQVVGPGFRQNTLYVITDVVYDPDIDQSRVTFEPVAEVSRVPE